MIAEPTDSELAAIAFLRTEDELLLDLGIAIAGDGVRRDGDEEDFRGRARNWLDRHRNTFRRLICGRASDLNDTVTDIALVADLIASEILNKPAAFSAAALLFKHGLRGLCAE